MTRGEFHNVISETINRLNNEASTKPGDITCLDTGMKFQNHVHEIVEEEAQKIDPGAKAYNKSGTAFPDIIIDCSDGKKYGLEVKSSKEDSDSWEIPGNSVNESTLVPDLEEIQLLFGKTYRLEFKAALYSDCVKAIKATHYPRYIIDMSINPSQTIFKAMNITYSEFNSIDKDARIQMIKDYYISKGEYYWWLSDNASNAIHLFENLDSDAKSQALSYCFVHYPELLSRRKNKYSRLAMYIASEYGAISTSLRDMVSAKGRDSLSTKKRTFTNVPRIFINMYANRSKIQSILDKSKLKDLRKDWNDSSKAKSKIQSWIDVMSQNAYKKDGLSEADREEILTSIIKDS